VPGRTGRRRTDAQCTVAGKGWWEVAVDLVLGRPQRKKERSYWAGALRSAIELNKQH
jgi:hypothetical protein